MNAVAIVLAVLFIASCTAGERIDSGAKEPSSAVGPARLSAVVCPMEDCRGAMINEIEKATTVSCAFYAVSDSGVIAALQAAHASLVVDDQAKDLGMGEARGPAQHTMHNKFCVLDGSKVLTGSFNPTARANQDLVVVMDSPDAAKAFQEEFDEMQAGVFGGGLPTKHQVFPMENGSLKVLFCPDDPCEEEVVSWISQSKEWVLVEAYSFTSWGVLDALKEADARGVRVIVVVEPSQEQAVDRLKGSSVLVVRFKGQGLLHRKLVVIDGRILIAGSANPTLSGFHANDENLLVVNDSVVARSVLKRIGCSSLDDLVFSKQFLKALELGC